MFVADYQTTSARPLRTSLDPVSQPAMPPALWWDGPAQRFAGRHAAATPFVDPIRLRPECSLHRWGK